LVTRVEQRRGGADRAVVHDARAVRAATAQRRQQRTQLVRIDGHGS
jgi:hypothetical protein